MKIHNNAPVSGKTTRKATQSSNSGIFGQLLDTSESPAAHDHSQSDQSPSEHSPSGQPLLTQQANTTAPMQEAWHTLQESVSLLDEAMYCIEAGNTPPQKLIHDIEQLRSVLRQQVNSGSTTVELKQADTLLAVEAERIRAMHS